MSEKRRQQKLAKRKAKSKAKQKQGKLSNVPRGDMFYIKDAMKNPISECLIDNSNAKNGMVHIMISKMSGMNVVVISAFLVDTFCLGIKDSFIKPGPIEKYKEHRERRPWKKVKAEDAKKLLLDVVEWSRNLGFEPHKDFKKAFKILDEVDVLTSKAVYEFGENGKPLFISGPYDSPTKCRRILKTLEKSCGTEEGNFNYIVPDLE